MNNLPIYISIVFIITTFITVGLFYMASRFSNATLFILLGWMSVQGIIGFTGFYTVTDAMPPRFFLVIMPALASIIALFLLPAGRRFVDKLDLKMLTALHVIRIPIETVLFWLFIQKAVPGLITFEGRNFDILSGLTAPVIYYFVFVKKRLGNTALLVWNIACLALLVNVVAHAILSAPFRFQQFAFDQPDIAILYFPYVWLPAIVVPLVLLSHLVSIRRLLIQRRSSTSTQKIIVGI